MATEFDHPAVLRDFYRDLDKLPPLDPPAVNRGGPLQVNGWRAIVIDRSIMDRAKNWKPDPNSYHWGDPATTSSAADDLRRTVQRQFLYGGFRSGKTHAVIANVAEGSDHYWRGAAADTAPPVAANWNVLAAATFPC